MKQAAQRLAVVVFVICLIPITLNILGVDFGTQGPSFDIEMAAKLSPGEQVDAMFHSLRGSYAHTLLEWSAFCTAIFTALLAFVVFRIKGDVTTPIIAMALFWAGCMDAFHTLAADRLLQVTANNNNLIPFTWAICRAFNALIGIAGIAVILTCGRRKKTTARNFGVVAIVSLVFGCFAYGVIRYCAVSESLPKTMFPDSLVTRPWDTVALFLFVINAGAFWLLYRRIGGIFAASMLISTIPDIATQLHMAFGSTALFDNHFNVAHFLKILSYFVPFVGLSIDYVATYRQDQVIALSLKAKIAEHNRTNQELIETKEQVEFANHRLNAMYSGLNDYIILAVTDAKGTITEANNAFCRISQYSREELVGQNHRILQSGVHDKSFWKQMWQTIVAGKIWHEEVCNRAKDGSLYWVDTTIFPLTNTTGLSESYLAIRVDITDRKRAEEGLIRTARIDDLTGLPNRAVFSDQLLQCLDRPSDPSQSTFAVIFIDLDNFKYVNDSLGHNAGDELLVEVATRLTAALRASDTVERIDAVSGEGIAARFGGDEFVVLLDGFGTPENVLKIVDRIQEVMSVPSVIGSQEITVQCSIGVVLDTRKYTHVEDVLRDADTAMYQAKASGKGRYTVFDESMHIRARERLNLENDLRCAVELGQIDVFYQPIVDLKTGNVVSFEALARWNHPTRGVLLPEDFIPIGEETGLIIPIGQLVLEQALALLERMGRNPKGELLGMNVNVSRRQLSDASFIPMVQSLLEKLSVSPDRLRLDITESVVTVSSDGLNETLGQLKAMGVEIHLDDFGTGLSSLSLLRELPLDGIKIDRSFVDAAHGDREAIAILHAIIALGHNLRKVITAEGIEDASQEAAVVDLECDFAQGYFFGRPAPEADVEAMIQTVFSSSLRQRAAMIDPD